MTSGMRALLIRIAKQLNRVMHSRGRLYEDRFHERTLTSPSEVRNVIRYVLGNRQRHCSASPQAGARLLSGEVDAFSSANAALADAREGPPWSRPESWLLRVGWRRGRGAQVPGSEQPTRR